MIDQLTHPFLIIPLLDYLSLIVLRSFDLTDSVGYLKLVPGSPEFDAWLSDVVARLAGPCVELPGFGSRFHGLHSWLSL